ncbi:hypothetical protein [Mesorhizobium sp. Root695]|uniref:hypothetical protein n=1 Tax=Mesorhizobium sp. Root695 TaxID=1736589 RepID=UPI00138F889F|nr:hypothetical protein [Mesorhizobium sp. Root695]
MITRNDAGRNFRGEQREGQETAYLRCIGVVEHGNVGEAAAGTVRKLIQVQVGPTQKVDQSAIGFSVAVRALCKHDPHFDAAPLHAN